MDILRLIFWTSFLLIGYTYLIYPVILFGLDKLCRKRHEPSIYNPDHPTVTVLVSVFNEENVLPKKLANIATIEYPREKLSFLFGSDGSTDKTVEILSNCGVMGVEVKVFSERRGKARILNSLFELVTSEIVVLSDANTILAPDAISKLTRHFHKPEVGAVCGSLVLRSDESTIGGLGESVYWRYENVLKLLESRIKTTVGATGALYAIRKSLLIPLPTHKAVPDDLVIPARALMRGLSIVYEKEAVAYEDISNSVVGEFQRKVRIGTRDYQSISELAPLLHPRMGFAAFALWSRKMIRWFVPIFLIILFLTALLLSFQSVPFLVIFTIQALFYVVACLGYVLEKGGIRMGLMGLPYYFSAMNLALLIGFTRFLRGKQSFTWDVIR